MIEFRYATIKELELLVELRIRDLKMFSKQKISADTINNIRDFYFNGLNNHTCFTILGYAQDKLVASGTLYLYQVMPSNDNPSGIMGQLTNIFVEKQYRHQKIATKIVTELIKIGEQICGMLCLNSSDEALGLYQKLGFQRKERYMVRKCH